MNYAVPSDNLLGLVLNIASNAVSEAIKKFERIIREKRSCKSRKRIHFVYVEWRQKWYYQNCKVVRIFSGINWWRYWSSYKRNKKIQDGAFLAGLFVPYLAASVVQSLISSVVKDNAGRVIMKAEENVITRIKILSFAPSLNQSWDFNYKPMFNGVFSRDNLPRIKDGMYVMNLYDKQSKENCTLILLEWIYFSKGIKQD